MVRAQFQLLECSTLGEDGARGKREMPKNMIMRNIIALRDNLTGFGDLTFQALYSVSGKWYFCRVESRCAFLKWRTCVWR